MNKIEQYNDTSSAVFTLLGCIKPTICYIYSPISPIYKQIAIKYHFTIELVNLYVDMNYPCQENSVIIFQNPTFADGSFYCLDKYMQTWISKKCTIIIDESLIDFTSFKSVSKYINSYEKIYIIKSLGSFYTKYKPTLCSIISNKDNINRLKYEEPKVEVSKENITYLNKIQNDVGYSKTTKTMNIIKKEKLYRYLENHNHIEKVFPSSTNRVLIYIDSSKYDDIQKELEIKQIKIISCKDNNIDFLDCNYMILLVA